MREIIGLATCPRTEKMAYVRMLLGGPIFGETITVTPLLGKNDVIDHPFGWMAHLAAIMNNVTYYYFDGR